MPDVGATYNLLTGTTNYPAVDMTVIDPDDHNSEMEDIATGITARVQRNGAGSMSGNLNMGANKLTSLGAGTSNGDSVRYEQVQLANAVATAWEGLSWAANKLGYATGASAFALVDVTAAGLGFLNFTDPNVDAIRFWDDSAGGFANLTLSELSISGTTLSVASTLDGKTLTNLTLSGTVAGSVSLSGTWTWGDALQSTAELGNRVNGNAIEWGHTNTSGYGSTLGSDVAAGTPFFAFHGEAGTTSNTYRTRGIRASIFKPDLSGGFVWANVATASADNQSPSTLMTLSNAGVLAAGGVNVALQNITLTAGAGLTGGGDLSASRSFAVDFASTAEIRANTANQVLGTDEAWDAVTTVGLTDAATIAVDMSTFINATVTLGGNRTLGQPNNTKVGQSGFIRIVQDGTGTRTLAYHADWKFAGGTDPTLSTAAGTTDILFYQVIATNFVYATLVAAVA